jgi:hypothetical protein
MQADKDHNRTNDDEIRTKEIQVDFLSIDKIRTCYAEFGNSAPIKLDFRPGAERYCGGSNLRP